MKSYAVIPAAGRSQRMGRPKLLLPWGGATVIEQVLATWRASRVDRIVIVVHPDDTQLAAVSKAAGAFVICPTEPPSEMKFSVQIALDQIAQWSPEPQDAWLLAPADMPALQPATINQLLEAYSQAYSQSLAQGLPAASIWVPSFQGRRGHPVLFAWKLASEVSQLAPGQGLNALVQRHTPQLVESGEDAILADIDTPEDYERLRTRWQA